MCSPHILDNTVRVLTAVVGTPNLVLDLPAEVGALLKVSEDADPTAMSPWRGVPILRAREFAGRVDADRDGTAAADRTTARRRR